MTVTEWRAAPALLRLATPWHAASPITAAASAAAVPDIRMVPFIRVRLPDPRLPVISAGTEPHPPLVNSRFAPLARAVNPCHAPAMRASARAAFLATLPVLALGAQTSRLAAAHPEAALGGGAPWESVVQVGAAVAAVAAGAVLVLEHRITACGLLLALTGPAILLAQLAVPDASSALLFTAGLAGASLAPALAGSAALTCPVAPLRSLDWAAVTLSLVTAGVILGLLPAAVFDPRAAGCFSCPANLAEVHANLSLYAALTRWGLILTIAWGIGRARWLARAARAAHRPDGQCPSHPQRWGDQPARCGRRAAYADAGDD